MSSKLLFHLGSFRLLSVPCPAPTSTSAGLSSLSLWQTSHTHRCPDPALAHELLGLASFQRDPLSLGTSSSWLASARTHQSDRYVPYLCIRAYIPALPPW